MKNNNLKKIGIVIVCILLLSINFQKNILALEPPAMSVIGKRNDVITPNNAILFTKCKNYSYDINKIEMTIYEDYKEKQVGKVEKIVDSNLPWVHVSYNVQKDMGIELQPGKEYYVHYHAICKNGGELKDYDNGYWFVTPNIELTTMKQNIVEDNAQIKVNIASHGSDKIVKAGVRVTCFGCIVGTVEKEVNKQTDELSINFDLKNQGKLNLLPNCNYQYNAYVVTKSLGKRKNEGRVDTYGSFKTLEDASFTKGINKITKKNVIICENLLNPRGKFIEKYGLVIKKGSKVIGQCEKLFPISERNITSKQLKFNIRKDMKKIKLVKGKKYKYEMYSFVGGKKYVINGALKVKKTIIKR